MGLCAAACIFIGVFPRALYAIMPFPVEKDPYTLASVITKTQLLVFSVLAFAVLIRTGLYPKEMASTNLNTDWFYRKPGNALVGGIARVAGGAGAAVTAGLAGLARKIGAWARSTHGPDGIMGRTWPTGTMALWTTLMLGAYLILSYI
jgi:multicomponent Na+:H+ antiporter subunit D